MKIIQHPNIHDFLKKNLAFLEQEEAANNLLLGLAFALRKMENPQTHPLLLTIEHKGKSVFCCLQTPPQNLVVYGDENYLNTSIKILIDYIKNYKLSIPGVVGPRFITSRIASQWSKAMQTECKISMEQLIYQLDKVENIKISPGVFRIAHSKDVEILTPWVEHFFKEALGKSSNGESIKIARRKIAAGDLYVWENEQGKVVSMAGITRPSRHGMTINFVYTPENHRRKGYASSCVARLSKLMLERNYRFCSLFTDRNNPWTKSIYQRIGYYLVREFQQIEFVEAAERAHSV